MRCSHITMAVAAAFLGHVGFAASAANDGRIKSIEFTSTDVSGLSDRDRASTYTKSSAIVKYLNGKTGTFPLSFVNLFNNYDTNKTRDGSPAAAIYDRNGAILADSKGKPFIAQTPDANSLLKVGSTPYLVTNWEYVNKDSAGVDQYGKLPMTMTLASLDQTRSDGKLAVRSIRQVDFSNIDGLWIPCGGSLSPWNTHLGSEEYEPDARCGVDNTYAKSSSCTNSEYTARMGAFRTLYGASQATPYDYGRTPEIKVSVSGKSSAQKWYTLGRISREKVQFFEDSRTAIQGDDGTYTMLSLFVADKPEDLSAGALYAAKWNQTSADNADGGSADLSWIKLGHAHHADIYAAVKSGVTFADLFDVDTTGAATPAAGFTRIKHGHEVATVEDLRLKAGSFNGVPVATLAAFLETRRYAAMLGATVEFEKFEGVAYNAKDKKAYAAMSRMSNGMETKSTDVANHIRVKKNLSGAVYELALSAFAKDTKGNLINSRFVPTKMSALVVGEDLPAQDAEGNKSVLAKIAGPDNVWFSDKMRVLFIGEDTSNHVNNYLWAYHVDTGKLARLLSLPMGAESTGLQVVDNMSGSAYIMSNYQHAGDKNSTLEPTYGNVMKYINPDKAEVGYIGGLPGIR